jgi:2-oxoglutarate ferredoxin oxidoreductase subunit delta
MAKRVVKKADPKVKARPSEPHSYKAEAQQSREPETRKKAYDIDIFMGWCKSCGICAAFCPRNCIKRDEDGAPVVEDSSRCTGCGWCEVHCPDFAISVRPRNLETVAPDEE